MKKFTEAIKTAVLSATFYEPSVVITGNRSVLIENVRRIFELNELLARFGTTEGEVVIWGEDLMAKSYKGTSVTIVGRIKSCELMRKAVNDENK